MASNTTWPDGEPRRSAADAGSSGGTKDGHAVRRADGWENPQRMGWLDGTPAAKSDPAGGSYVPIGPGSRAFDATPPDAPYTTGMQRNRKPKR